MADGRSRGDGGELRLPFLFVPHGDPLPLAWMAEHPGFVRVPATFVPREPPRPDPAARRPIRPRPDAAPALRDGHALPHRPLPSGVYRTRHPSTLPDPPGTSAGTDPVALWRSLMAEVADQMARYVPPTQGTGTTSGPVAGHDARGPGEARPHAVPQTPPASRPSPDAPPHVPEMGREIIGGGATEPPRASAQSPHTDVWTDPHDMKDSSEPAVGSENSEFWNYLRSSADALEQIPKDLGDLLGDPSQIPDALASVLPALAPEAAEALNIVSAPSSLARRLDDAGRPDGVPPDSFTGNSRNQYQAPQGTPPRNAPGTIGTTPISGHALDQAQNRGVPYSVIEQALRDGQATPDLPGTGRIYDPVNKITIFQNSETGNIITLRMGE